MKRPWHIVAVDDVVASSRWYVALLEAQENHPGATVFNQIVDQDGTVLLCLHRWGPSGPHGDHKWHSLMNKQKGQSGTGVLLWFVVDDFDAAWTRAQKMGAVVDEAPNMDNGTGMRAFVLRDPDGYYVTINELREKKAAS